MTEDKVPAFTPVTVINPVVLLMLTDLPREFVTDHVVEVSKLVIGNVKPSTVEVGEPNVGTLAAPVRELIADEVAVPVSYPVRVERTVTVEAVPGFTPVTVISPVVPLMVTVLPSELVALQV